MKNDDFVFYLTSERQGLYLGNKLILTVEEVQSGIRPHFQISLFDFEENDNEEI